MWRILFIYFYFFYKVVFYFSKKNKVGFFIGRGIGILVGPTSSSAVRTGKSRRGLSSRLRDFIVRLPFRDYYYYFF